MQEHRQCVLLPVQGDEPSPSLYEAGGANGGCPAEAKLEEDAEQDIWQEAQPRLGHTQPSRPQIIAQRLRESQETQEIIIKAMNQLRGRGSIWQRQQGTSEYPNCIEASAQGCGYTQYEH